MSLCSINVRLFGVFFRKVLADVRYFEIRVLFGWCSMTKGIIFLIGFSVSCSMSRRSSCLALSMANFTLW